MTHSAAPAAAPDAVDPAALSTLASMGFPEVRCGKALRATGGNVEAALEWLMAHMDDPGIDDPEPAGAGAAGGGGGGAAAAADPEAVASLASMGFSDARATRALRETGGSVERAVEWLFSHADDPEDDAMDVAADGAATAAPAADEPRIDSAAPAGYDLFGVIAHKGSSVHAGHYVAYVRRGGRWVLFNDRKVAACAEVMESAAAQGYVYLFKKRSSA
jgi:ubiquitin carboxyl-terminal hydrolase 5/13